MDAAQVVIEEPVEPVDRFAGLTFGEACEMLFSECKSNAPSSEGFQNMIDYIGKVHVAMGIEFSPESYWNEGTISGGHEVFPPGIGDALNHLPDELTREYLQGMIEKIGALETATSQYRANHERVAGSNSSRTRSGNGIIDTRILTRSVNTAPVFMLVSETDDEDDFI